jgi:hypothetical protein
MMVVYIAFGATLYLDKQRKDREIQAISAELIDQLHELRRQK